MLFTAHIYEYLGSPSHQHVTMLLGEVQSCNLQLKEW